MTVTKLVQLSDKDKARFLDKVGPSEPGTGCMLWQAGLALDGRYGRFQLNGKVYYAHRVAYVLHTGDQIPAGSYVDHKCHVTQCMNPDHLQVVTPKGNSENLKGAQAGSKSGVRGVNWNDGHRLWFVRVGHNGRRYFGGYFKDVKQAEEAAIALRNKLYKNNLRDRSHQPAAD